MSSTRHLLRSHVTMLFGISALLFIFILIPTQSVSALTYTVNTTADDIIGVCDATHCSLREAIIDANANAGADTISFSIGTGVQTISPTSPLPTITGQVTIDGTTQTGFTTAPLIVLDGSLAGTTEFDHGLEFGTGSTNSIIRSLVI